MTRLKVNGRFIGNTSCGFTHGSTYTINITFENGYLWVRDAHGFANCPYRSIQTLAANWEIPTAYPVSSSGSSMITSSH